MQEEAVLASEKRSEVFSAADKCAVVKEPARLNAAELSVLVCFLTRSFSSPQQSELLNRGAASQGHVTPAAVIDRQLAR